MWRQSCVRLPQGRDGRRKLLMLSCIAGCLPAGNNALWRGALQFPAWPQQAPLCWENGFCAPTEWEGQRNIPKSSAGVQQTAPLNKDEFKDTVPKCCRFTCRSALRSNHYMLQQQRHG